jgi:hypothetical protein
MWCGKGLTTLQQDTQPSSSGPKSKPSSKPSSSLKIEAVHCLNILENFWQITWHNIPAITIVRTLYLTQFTHALSFTCDSLTFSGFLLYTFKIAWPI